MPVKKPAAVVGGVLLTAGALLGGCVTPEYQYTAAGATIGGIAGAVLGHQVNGKNGRYAGAAAGAAIGAAIGNNADAVHNRGYRQPYRSGPVRDYPPQAQGAGGGYGDGYGYEDTRYRYYGN